MINRDEVQRLIDGRRHFVIGTRGIAVECYPGENFGWTVTIPRAFFRADVDCIEIDVCCLKLGVEAGYVTAGLIDLSGYSKLTVME